LLSRISPHGRAVLQALIVTFLWSTSWVLIKFGLRDEIPALTFAGLRYFLAFLCLLPLFLRRREQHAQLRQLGTIGWLRLLLLGLLFYTVTQGAQFAGLALLPAITVNLLLSLTTLIVTFMGMAMLNERPTGLQWVGLCCYLAGVVLYFFPVTLAAEQASGVAIVLAGVVANAVSTLLGRAINREGTLAPLTVTVVSMGLGAIALLGAGIALQGLPPISAGGWLMILWLAVVNTAFAFTLWNRSLRELSAMESSIINNLMMIQIPVLAWLFLGEGISLKAGIAYTLAGAGIMVVQLRRLPVRLFRSAFRQTTG